MLECEDSSRENQKKNKKTLDLRESAVWSGRGGWACPLACKVFLFFFGFLEWNPHLLATTQVFSDCFSFRGVIQRSSGMWARMGDWACFDGFLEWNFHLPAPALRFFDLYYMPYTIYDLVYTIYCVMYIVYGIMYIMYYLQYTLLFSSPVYYTTL